MGKRTASWLVVAAIICSPASNALSQDCPEFFGSVDTKGHAGRVAVSGSHAYVADRLWGLRVIDVSDPANPVEVGFVDTNYSWDVAVWGSHAFVADGEAGLRVIDVSDPTAPFEVGFWDQGTMYTAVAVEGGYAYVMDVFPYPPYLTLVVIDVHIPSAPVEVADIFFGGGEGYSIVVSDGYAFVPSGGGLLRVIDVSDPANPVEVATKSLPQGINDLAVSNSHLFISDQHELRVLDVSDPTAPTEVGFYDFNAHSGPWAVTGIAVSGPYVFASAYFQYVYSLRVIDFSSRSSPVEVGYSKRGGRAWGGDVTHHRGFVYWAAWELGMEIYEVSACEGWSFSDGFESGDTSAWSATVP